MRVGACILAAVAILALGMACTKTDNKAVAKLGKDAVTVKMIKDQYLAISQASRPDLKTIDEKEAFAKDIVSKQIMWLEGRKLGLDRLPEVNQAAQTAVTRKAWQIYYEEQVRSQIKVTDKDLEDLHAKQTADYHIAWIFVRSKVLAEEIDRRLAGGEDFGKMAALYSIDPTRSQGGDIGFRGLGLMPDAVEAKLVTLAPGGTSGVLPYESYYALLKMIEKKDRQPLAFDQARAGLEATVRMTRENMRQREMASEIKQAYGFAFNSAAVDMIVAKTRALYQGPDSPPGQMPDFSEEELNRDLATWKGGGWKVRHYVERVKGLVDYMRPGYGVDQETIESLVGDYVTGELWGVEIKAKGYDTRPEALQAGQRAMEQTVVTALHDQLVKDVKVDSAKIAAFYEENKAQLVSEAGVNIAVIITADEAGAKAAYDQLAAGARFEAVAVQRSMEKDSAGRGGLLPRPMYKSEMERFPDLQGVVDNLQVGAHSTPMPVPPGFGAEGYMVVKLVERLEPRQLELAEIKDMLTPRVLQLEQDRTFGDWLKSKMDEYKVEVYPDVMARIDFAALKSQAT